MWQVLIDHFRRFPAQEKVVRLLIQNGLRIEGDRVLAGGIEVSDTAIARAANVDRRIVRATVQTVGQNPQLNRVFSRFSPTLHLKDVGTIMGAGVLQINVADPNQPGILAAVSNAIAGEGLSIRQAIVEDADFTEEPALFVVTDRAIPGGLIPRLQQLPGIKAVTVRGAGETSA